MTKAELSKAAMNLSPAERFELAQRLWESLEPNKEDGAIPFYEWQREAIDLALTNYEANPDSAVPAEEAEAEIRTRLGLE